MAVWPPPNHSLIFTVWAGNCLFPSTGPVTRGTCGSELPRENVPAVFGKGPLIRVGFGVANRLAPLGPPVARGQKKRVFLLQFSNHGI